MLKKPYSYHDLLSRPIKNPTSPLDKQIEGGVCLWLVKRVDGELYVLFQKRALSVTNGGLFDASAGGHIDAGEDALAAVLRETKEELGLSFKDSDLRFLFSFMTDNRFISVYLSDRTQKDDQFTLDSAEVDSVEWIALKDLDSFAKKFVKPSLLEKSLHLENLKFYLTHYL